jgi:hypothetical protein
MYPAQRVNMQQSLLHLCTTVLSTLAHTDSGATGTRSTTSASCRVTRIIIATDRDSDESRSPHEVIIGFNAKHPVRIRILD